MLLEELYAQRLLTVTEGPRILIAGKNSPSQNGHNDFERLWCKYPRSFVMVNGYEKCTILVPSQSHNYVLYSDKEKAKLGEVIKMEKVVLSGKCEFVGDENVQDVSSG